ncbi:MAG: NAD-dependent epimerase/dehydratase family protein [Euryarchaeota archaeon]|nr:NAD-dependent epimerase/dehydratase family protein [Euryarchaeota archaeon]
MRVAVTGVSGYLGGILLRLLEGDPGVEEVVGIDLQPPRGEHPKLRFIAGDVREPAIEGSLRGCDAVVHLAFVVARAPGAIRMQNDRAIHHINVGGSVNVFECAARAGVGHIVHASSIAAYGNWPDNPRLITEECALRPNRGFYYSETKARVEEHIVRFREANPGVKVTLLRPSLFVGPTINNPFGRLLTLRRSPVFMGYDPEVQFTWDEDVAGAFHLALRRSPGGAFNIAAEPPVRWSRIGPILEKKSIRVPYPLVAGFNRLLWRLRLSGVHPGWLGYCKYGIVVSSAKARRELGWEPRYTCEDALRKFAGM